MATVFDIDGTLLTTGGADAMAWDRAFEEQYGASAAGAASWSWLALPH